MLNEILMQSFFNTARPKTAPKVYRLLGEIEGISMQYGFLAFSIVASCALIGLEETNAPVLKEHIPTKAPLQPGKDCLTNAYSSGYNSPANSRFKDQCGGFVTASYLYWFVQQEGMDLATTALYLPDSNGVVPSTNGNTTVFQKGNYSSGFKVGLGCNLNHHDHWVLRGDYTWVRVSESFSQTAPPISFPDSEAFLTAENVFYMTSWFLQNASTGQPIAVQTLSSFWKMHMDLVDLILTRPCYEGKSWIISPFGGLRAAFIRQFFRIEGSPVLNIIPPEEPVASLNQSHSWGIGPRAGLGAHLLLKSGFRIQGDFGASLLFTQYTKVKHQESPISLFYPVSYSFHNYNCLRPMAEMSLGLGWLCYIDNTATLDLSATYDFNYMWGQNMIRTLNDVSVFGSSGASNNLYLHGLTASATFNF